MPTTVFPGCPCCGPASGSGSSGSGRRRQYTTCNECFGTERPAGVYPATMTVTYIDHGNAVVVMTGGGTSEYLGDASVIPYLEGMYAQTALCGGIGGTWVFKGCTLESITALEMLSCNPIVLYGATPFGTVTITEDGSSPALPSLGSTVPGCDGISGTLDVTPTGGAGCLVPFQIVRVPPGVPVPCNHWEGNSGCPCAPNGTLTLECTGTGTWTATFADVPLTFVSQTSDPFSVTFSLDSEIECEPYLMAGTVFVVTEP